MADFDEYDYLEKQLEQKDQANGKTESGSREDRDKRDHRSGEKRSSRDGDRERKHSSRSKSRDRRRRRSRSRDRDSKKHRTRSRSPPRASQARLPPKPRAATPPEVREMREKERELAELDRDTRTVFAYNLNLRAEERDLFQFFSKAGKVLDVRIITDRNTRKSKGFAYIEFAKREDIVNALALTGQMLMGQAVMVKSSEAEKNLAWEANQQQTQALAAMNALMPQMGVGGTGPCKLLVNNLHPNITEVDLKQIFDPFGFVDLVTLNKDASGRSQGMGYVQFQSMSDATKAIQQLDGLEIAGMKISVSIAAMMPGDLSAMAAPQIDLDNQEDEYGGLKLTSNARAALMNRLAGPAALAGSGANTIPLGSGVPGMVAAGGQLPGPPGVPQAGGVHIVNSALQLEQGVLGPSSPIPTPCLLLKNMFDPAEETAPDWEVEIGDDVRDECSKYGQVQHLYVDKNSKGFVYLKFAAAEGAAAAQKALHGRWFASRQIIAEFQFAQIYSQHFRC
ncbi:hypothetical protein WJX72_004426 [[Myrmecia] bisecta]|uniref:RRM domain-containing protein n=1 Tax=[Myrmecia] bisecta TaxID=41462 RepID=A0AAW1QQ91_9CHLO